MRRLSLRLPACACTPAAELHADLLSHARKEALRGRAPAAERHRDFGIVYESVQGDVAFIHVFTLLMFFVFAVDQHNAVSQRPSPSSCHYVGFPES